MNGKAATADLRQRKRDEGIAELGPHAAVASGRNDYVLFAVVTKAIRQKSAVEARDGCRPA